MRIEEQGLYARLLICETGISSALLGAYFNSFGVFFILFILSNIINYMLWNSITYERYTIGVMTVLWFFTGFFWGAYFDKVLLTVFIGTLGGLILAYASMIFNQFILRVESND